MEKPATLIYEELKSNIADLINGSGLPAFMVEPILKEYLEETRLSAKRQYECDKERYASSVANEQRELNQPADVEAAESTGKRNKAKEA